MAVDRLIPTSPPADTTMAYFAAQVQEELTPLWRAVTIALVSTGAMPNAITASGTPAMTAYGDSTNFTVVASATNTGPMTINIDGLGPRPLVSATNSSLAAGQVVAGQMLQIAWDASINAFRILGGLASSGAALPAPTQQWQVLQADASLSWQPSQTLMSGNF